MVPEPESQLTRARSLLDREPALPDGPGGRTGALTRLCAALVRAVPASGAGMTVTLADSPAMVLAASGPQAEELEELQLTIGEGPCVDAATDRRPVLEPDLSGAGSRRWPAYAPAAHALSVGAVFAFPIQVGAACLGVLDIYREEPGSLPTAGLGDAFAFADVALEVLLDDQQDLVGPQPSTLGEALTPLELYQAQGMVMIQLGGTLAEAMVRIRAFAYAHDQRLGDVARDIASGRLALTSDGR